MKIQQTSDYLPSRVIYEITQLCTFDCPECIARVNKPYLHGATLDEMVTIGKKCVDEEICSISWTGGEPYIRKEFLDAMEQIVAYDTDNKVVQTVDTNGVLITPEIAERSAKVFSLARVSIYGTLKTFNKSIGLGLTSKYQYSDAFKGMSYFLDAKLNLQINIPVYNIEDLDVMMDEINKKFGGNSLIEEIVFIPRINTGHLTYNNLDYPSREKIANYIEKNKQNFQFQTRLFEWKLGKHMVIKADNQVYAHPVVGTQGGLLHIGDVLEQSITNLWKIFPDEFKKDHRRLTPSIDHLKR